MGKELQKLFEEIQGKYLVVSGSSTGKQADAVVNLTDKEAQAISGSNVSVNKVKTVAEGDFVESGDVVNIAKQIGKSVVAVLRDHGDDVATVTAKHVSKEGVTIVVRYKADDQGKEWEDEFKFEFRDEAIYLQNGQESIEICPLQQQSGTAALSKDLIQDKLAQFIDSKEDIKTQQVSSEEVPQGLPVNEEQLWESEESYQTFCSAIDQYKRGGGKEAVKALLKSSRGFRKGNTIQEKFKNAVDYYKKEKQPVLSEGDLVDGELADVLWNICQRLRYTMQDLESYANHIYPTGLAMEWNEKIESVLDEIWQKYEDEAPESLDETERPVEDELPVESPSDPRSQTSGTIQISPSLLIRLLEYSREDVKDDVEIHNIVEKISRIPGEVTMDNYMELIGTDRVSPEPEEQPLPTPEEPEELQDTQTEGLGDYDEETERVEGYPEIGDEFNIQGTNIKVIDVSGDAYVLQSVENPKIVFTWKPEEDLESTYQKAVGEAEEVVGELSSQTLDRATDAARIAGRLGQSNTFRAGAEKERKKELGVVDQDSVHMTKEQCTVEDVDITVTVTRGGMVSVSKDGTGQEVEWPLEAKNKLTSKPLARVIAKWCKVYLNDRLPEKQASQYYDWHNWVKL